MHRLGALLLLLAGLMIAGPVSAKPAKLSIETFAGGFASVNSYIISNGKSLVVVDAQRKSAEAEKLAKAIRRYKLPVTHILITHGHTDHFTGLPVMMKAFPKAQVVVASDAIRKDIKAYAIYMDGFGATAAEPVLEPALKPRSPENPRGFDYERNIHVLAAPVIKMRGGGRIELTDKYPPTEAAHMTTAYIPALNALLLSDLAYNRVHFWMGDDIKWSAIANWRAALVDLQRRYAKLRPSVYPGHGKPGDLTILSDSVRYIDDISRVARQASSAATADAEMRRLYPDYGEADFFLKYSIEHLVGDGSARP